MRASMSFAALATLFVTLASPALAFNAGKTDIDYNPSITSPTTGVVWLAGATYPVTWNAVLPPGINLTDVSQTATLALGFKENGSENLDYILATDVPLYTSNGTFEVTLPSNLTLKTDYIIALIGSSGDVSPQFTIVPSLLRETRMHRVRA